MTPDEILRDLRDIHLPEQAVDAAGVGLVLWPIMAVVVLALLAGWLEWRRRSAWRREIVRHLDVIEMRADQGHALEGWTELAILLRRVAVMQCGKQDVAGLIGEAWLEKLDQLFKTDAFVSGPGRGITVHPYSVTSAGEIDDSRSGAGQLLATIVEVRRRLSHLGTAARWN